ncbi:hypothetical protein [Eisenibacter elegans]|jgi:hypothetical protein|uniref:DUF7873 family protein n=1 Tax=Eisenibacter elegans TaxID=997 RepID=UPI0004109E6B|nr:hypothetical protein [Eisenibacter elegans]
MANKLHELLAVEQDRRNKANEAVGEAKKIFTKNDSYFDGLVKKYVSMEEDSELIPDETKEMVKTVKQQLEETQQSIITALDATISKEETNAANVAKAELEVNGVKFGAFSATTLLALESQLNKILDLYKNIPLLDTTRKWHFDTQQGFFKTDEEVKFRSIKRPKVIVKYEATEKHPAQTELVNLDFQVGKYETTYYSGKLTPMQKSEMVKRIEQLLEAVKVARAKANNVEVVKVNVGKQLFDFIHKDLL